MLDVASGFVNRNFETVALKTPVPSLPPSITSVCATFGLSDLPYDTASIVLDAERSFNLDGQVVGMVVHDPLDTIRYLIYPISRILDQVVNLPSKSSENAAAVKSGG